MDIRPAAGGLVKELSGGAAGRGRERIVPRPRPAGTFDQQGRGAYDQPKLGAYADLVTAPGFKPGVAAAKWPGGFDSHPLPSARSVTWPAVGIYRLASRGDGRLATAAAVVITFDSASASKNVRCNSELPPGL